jgi:hypothetical protein
MTSEHPLYPLNDEIVNHFRSLASLLERHVEPLFALQESGFIEFEGTGILATINARHYLITAAHIVDACKYGIVLGTVQGEARPLINDGVVTKKPVTKTRQEDRFDIGFVRLTEDESHALGRSRFLDLANVYEGPLPEQPIPLVAIGYPARDQIVDNVDGIIRTAPMRFWTTFASIKGYRGTKTDTRGHVLLRFQKRDIVYNNTRGSPPNFRGMSGGPVWPISLEGSPPSQNLPPLLAMIVERPDGYGPSIRATRATAIRYFVTTFDDSGDLETDRFLRVTLTAIVWYRPEGYDQLRAIFVDGDKLHPDYWHWLKEASTGEGLLRANGGKVVRAEIRPEAFKEWCRNRQCPLDSAARSSYANWVASRGDCGSS